MNSVASDPVGLQSSQHPLGPTDAVSQDPHPACVAHHGTGQSGSAHPSNVRPLYVHVLWHVQCRAVVGGSSAAAAGAFASRSHVVESTDATPTMCHGSRLLSYTGTETDVSGPQMAGMESYGSVHVGVSCLSSVFCSA